MYLLNIFAVAPWTDPSLPRAPVSCFLVTLSPGPACVFSDSCPITDRVSVSVINPELIWISDSKIFPEEMFTWWRSKQRGHHVSGGEWKERGWLTSAPVDGFRFRGWVAESGEATRAMKLSLGEGLVWNRLPFLPLPSSSALLMVLTQINYDIL